MVKVVEDTVTEVDVAALIVEPIANIGAPEEKLITQIEAAGIPAILVINKIDTVKHEDLLAVIAAYAICRGRAGLGTHRQESLGAHG